MTSQHSHSSTPFSQKKFPIIVVCDAVSSPANIGALFRVSEAFGVEEIIFCGPSIDLSSTRVKRTARNTLEKVPYSIKEDVLSELQQLKTNGYELLALEITNNSVLLENLHLNESKVAIIIGNERNGISKAALNMVSQTIHLEMYGKNSSMNVVQAAGIALYSITKKLKL